MASVMMGEAHFINLKIPFSIFQVPPFPSTFDLCQIPRKRNLNTLLQHPTIEEGCCHMVREASDLGTVKGNVQAKGVFSVGC